MVLPAHISTAQSRRAKTQRFARAEVPQRPEVLRLAAIRDAKVESISLRRVKLVVSHVIRVVRALCAKRISTLFYRKREAPL